MLDLLYRALLRLLPRRFDAADRDEMWDTYRHRVDARERSSGAGAASDLRKRELVDLLRTFAPGKSASGSLDTLRQDIRFGIRSLARTPVTSSLAVVSLALGIGATTAIFGALDVWLFRPLPLGNASRLVGVGMANFERGWDFNVFSVPDFVDWRRGSSTVDLGAYMQASYNFAAGDQAERATALVTSHNLPDVLGIEPRAGRTFTAEEGTTTGPRVVLLSDSFWKDALGADDGILGSDVVLDGTAHTVIGILPTGVSIPGVPADLWVPLRVSGQEARDGHVLQAVGLLADGVTLEVARAELRSVAATVVERDPERTFPNAAVVPFRDVVYGTEFEQGGLVMGGAVAFVLLIACLNIANLLLARGLGRGHEIAVRGALGAGRGRVVRQLLTESLIIAVAGGVLGLAVAWAAVRLLVRYVFMPPAVPGWDLIGIDARALAVTAALALVSTLIFGLLPALRTSKVDLRGRLADGNRAGVGRRRGRLASALVVGEVAASMALLVACGLLIRDMAGLQTREMSMRTHDALIFRVSPPRASYESMTEVAVLLQEFSSRIAAIPGVEGVASSSGHPVSGWSSNLYTVTGVESDADTRQSAEARRVSSTYRDVMELRLVAGRWFDAAVDTPEGTPVAVVSRVLADRWWSTPAEALGKEVDNGGRRRIIGVVESPRIRGAHRDPPPLILEWFEQRPTRTRFFVVTHTAGMNDLAASVREVLRDVDPTLALIGPMSIEAAVADGLGGQWAGLQILGALGGLALALTLVGVYGVTAHSVGQRSREMGLRVALGATGTGVTRLVMRRGAFVAALGIIIGTGLGLLLGTGLAFLLVGVSPADPATLGMVAALLFVAVLAASYVPARRAARVDPVRVMKAR